MIMRIIRERPTAYLDLIDAWCSAAKLCEQALHLIRMAWILKNQQSRLQQAALNEKEALLAAKDAEIARLREAANEPELPIEKANGHANGADHDRVA